ncbi:GNAT family N-acetyltransferase [Lacibacterium aquatile]|uniref:GNAT family N-acetyltransferase n=1 Tax=Lacibacterium aquatile TaxID=1168082 RepID=A0ABW5DMY5_9PROT
MADLTFRKAMAGDVPVIVAMLADDPLGAQREKLGPPLGEAYLPAFAAIDSNPMNELIVAELTGEVVGCMQLTFIPGLSHQGMTRCLIEAVRVRADQRGKKFGEAMMAHAVERAKARQAGVVQLTSDKSRLDAHRFYERLGFKQSHAGFKLKL